MMNPIGNLKDIFIGKYIEERIKESGISLERLAKFVGIKEEEIKQVYDCQSIDANQLLRFSKILEYDFFRLYSQHLIFYSPVAAANPELKSVKKTKLPQFRKNIYTQEVIDFILKLIRSEEKTTSQIIEEYRIPRSTLYRWLSKY
ncbi:transposase [Soonwooa sp.]|uniref:transposase n=1 Tax=Soonwooa sp. TaxID=1938592 RepID=UPI00262D19FF|nr:transposase [Soonwooa sp.]